MYRHQNPQWYQQQFPQLHELQQTSFLNKVSNCLRCSFNLYWTRSFVLFLFLLLLLLLLFSALNFFLVYKLAKLKTNNFLISSQWWSHTKPLAHKYRLLPSDRWFSFYKTNNLFTDSISGKSTWTGRGKHSNEAIKNT